MLANVNEHSTGRRSRPRRRGVRPVLGLGLSAVLGAALALVVACGAPTPAAGSESSGSDGVILALTKSATADQVARAISKSSATVEYAVPGTRTMLVYAAGTSDDVLAERLADMPGVRYAEPNTLVHALATPNDPFFGQQWGLTAINASSAWDGARASSSVIVAVVDTGVYVQHPDLAGILDTANDWDFVRNDSEANDEESHGTHVAGIIGAIANNSLGVAGLAGFGPSGQAGGVTILPVKVLDRNGEGTVDDVALGIRWAADHGARVINLSLGGDASTTMADAVAYARSAGCFIAAAAGNDGVSAVFYPAGYDGVTGVASINGSLQRSSFSNAGPHVDIAAPGEGIYSTILPTAPIAGGNLYLSLSGTSMATPFVSAAAALLFSAVPGMTAVQAESVLQASARDVGLPGRDDSYGAGVLDVAEATHRATGADWIPPVTAAQLTPSGWTSSNVNVKLTAVDAWSPIAGTYISIGTGPEEIYNGSATVSTEGVIPVRFRSVDTAGNWEDMRTATAYVDKTPPTLQVTVQPTYTDRASITLSATDGLSGFASFAWVLDGVSGSNRTVTTSLVGSHTLTVTALDTAGNRAPEQRFDFSVQASPSPPGGGGGGDGGTVTPPPSDTTPPTTRASGVPDGWSRVPVALTLSASDGTGAGVARTWLSVNGAGAQLYAGAFTIANQGITTITYWSEDKASPPNTEQHQRVDVLIDSTPPAISLSATATYEETAVVLATATDTVSGVDVSTWSWSLDGGSWQTGAVATISAPGRHTIAFRARDNAGNVSERSNSILVTKASRVLVSPTPASVSWQAWASVSGDVTGTPGASTFGPTEVVLETRTSTSGSWSRTASAMVSADGRFAMRFKPLVRTYYRVRFVGNEVVRGSVSSIGSIAPRVSLTMPGVTPFAPKAGVTLMLSGRLAPAHSTGIRLRMERQLASGAWTKPQWVRAKMTSGGKEASIYRATARLSRGRWRIRAYHPDDGRHAATYSSSRYVTVR